MDREVTVRFYEVTNIDGGEPLADVINKISAKAKRDREQELGNGLRLRLEEVNTSGGLLLGDLTRIQTQNLPGQVTDADTSPLPFGELGHSIGFVFDPQSNGIGIQFNQSVRAGKVLEYFSKFSRTSQYYYMPMLNEASVEKFGRETVKKLSVRVSSIKKFRQATGNQNDFEQAIDQMATMYGGSSVEVSISTRAKKKPLQGSEVIDTIRRMIAIKEETDSVRKITASTFEEEDVYNFIKQLLKEQDTLDLPDNDPDKARELRLKFLRNAYGKHKRFIRETLGAE